MKKHERLLNVAIEAAKVSKSNSRHKHAAVMVAGSSILVGTNCNKSDPRVSRASRHAEAHVLRLHPSPAGRDLYVARHSNVSALNSKPCEACVEACRAAGIRRVFYTVDDSTFAVLRLYKT